MLSPLHTALKIPGLRLGKGEECERQKKGAEEKILAFEGLEKINR